MGRKKRRETQNNRKKNKISPEARDIWMEINQPENIAVAIPENFSQNIVSIGIETIIKSFTDKYFLFQNTGYIPELVINKKVLKGEKNINESVDKYRSNWKLLKRGFHGQVYQDFEIEIYWHNDLLYLKISTLVLYMEKYISDIFWTFQGLIPGNYQLRFLYQNTSNEEILYLQEDNKRVNDDEKVEIFTDTLTTNCVNIYLLQSIENRREAIEFNGLVFKNLIPYREISLNKILSPSGKFHIGGIQIFNNTSVGYYFSVHFTIKPQIISEQGEEVYVHELPSDWFQLEATDSDIFLSKPGRNTFLFIDTRLWKLDNYSFNLVFYSNYGGGWCYGPIELNKTYKINFTYTNKSDSIKYLPIDFNENNEIIFWQGKLITPFVNFRLVT